MSSPRVAALLAEAHDTVHGIIAAGIVGGLLDPVAMCGTAYTMAFEAALALAAKDPAYAAALLADIDHEVLSDDRRASVHERHHYLRRLIVAEPTGGES